jgi:two-component sensor histidine kinase
MLSAFSLRLDCDMQKSAPGSAELLYNASLTRCDNSAPHNATRPVLILVALSIVIPLAVLVLGAIYSYGPQLDRSSRALTHLTGIIHRHTAAALTYVESVAKQVDSILAETPQQENLAGSASLRRELKSILAGVDEIQDISILDRDGQMLISTSASPETVGRVPEDKLKENQLSVLQVAPVNIRQKPSVQFIWPRKNVRGDFAGTIVMSAQPGFFSNFSAEFVDPLVSSVMLIRDDGAILAAVTKRTGGASISAPYSGFVEEISKNPGRGFYETMYTVDGVGIPAYAFYEKLPGHAVYVAASMKRSTIVAKCKDALMAELTIGAPLMLVLLLVGLVVLRFSRREAAALNDLHEEACRRRLAEEQTRLLSYEVSHRAKNMLAIVQSIASQTAAKSEPVAFATKLTQRIAGLAAGLDLLSRSGWDGVDLDELIRSQLAPFTDLSEHRVGLAGPPIRLRAAAAQTLGMALHELATNAVKYGALSSTQGRISIEWSRLIHGSGERFRMRWSESGGPEPELPTRQGFGHTVLAGVAESSLNGIVKLLYPNSGLVWELDCPLDEVLDAGPVIQGGLAPPEGNGSLTVRGSALFGSTSGP